MVVDVAVDLHPDILGNQDGCEVIDAAELFEGLHEVSCGDRVLVGTQGDSTLFHIVLRGYTDPPAIEVHFPHSPSGRLRIGPQGRPEFHHYLQVVVLAVHEVLGLAVDLIGGLEE